MGLQVVLVEPQIPQNTGNIARTCVAIGAKLHLVEPLGFSVSEKAVRRAGLDYWQYLDWSVWPDLPALLDYLAGEEKKANGLCFDRYFLTTKAARLYSEVVYGADTVLFFGKETRGLPLFLLEQNKEHCVRIPMVLANRSLNLSNAVAVAAYEVMRQNKFVGLAADKHKI